MFLLTIPVDRDDDERADEAPDLHGRPDRSPQEVGQIVHCLEQPGLQARDVIRHCNGCPAGRQEESAHDDRGHLLGPHSAWSSFGVAMSFKGAPYRSCVRHVSGDKGQNDPWRAQPKSRRWLHEFFGPPSRRTASRPGSDAGRIRPDAVSRGGHLHDCGHGWATSRPRPSTRPTPASAARQPRRPLGVVAAETTAVVPAGSRRRRHPPPPWPRRRCHGAAAPATTVPPMPTLVSIGASFRDTSTSTSSGSELDCLDDGHRRDDKQHRRSGGNGHAHGADVGGKHLV